MARNAHRPPLAALLTRLPRARAVSRAIVGGVLLVAAAAPLHAQPQWWAFDTSPAGTPPTIQLLPASNINQTVLDITLHGFYYETIVQSGQTFRRLSFDKRHDEAVYRSLGLPELPTLHHLIANPGGGPIGPATVQLLNETTIPGAVIWPVQQPRRSDGSPPPPFQWNALFYQQRTLPYPAASAQSLGSPGRLWRLPLLTCESHPFRAIPANQSLLVATHYVVTFPHLASIALLGGIPPLTSRQFETIRRRVVNPSLIQAVPGVDPAFAGDYLIVTDPDFVEEVEPLADQKRSRGYATTVVTTADADVGSNCASIRDYIHDWWPLGSSDAYVLLVGDVEQVPSCDNENGQLSDRVYACIDGLSDFDGLSDPFAEIRLGRLPCGSEAECEAMVSKTLSYERGNSGSWYDIISLVAHQDETYEAAHDDVAAVAYDPDQTFSKLYGGSFFVNADVTNDIEEGCGLVCYRGPGLSDSWWNWTFDDDDFDIPLVSALANGNKTPVVLSLGSINNWIDASDLATGDCIGEMWMKGPNRAVAHYAPSHYGFVEADDAFEVALFASVYGAGVVVLGDALLSADIDMINRYPDNIVGAINGEDNAWMNLLLGDPELKIWREDPFPMMLRGHMVSVPKPSPQNHLTFGGYTYRPASGGSKVAGAADSIPVPGATVVVYKPGDFMAVTRTGSNGAYTFALQPNSTGPMYLTAYTDSGSNGVGQDTIDIYDPVGVPENDGPHSVQFEPIWPNPMRELATFAVVTPRPGRIRLEVFDINGRRMANIVDRMVPAGRHTYDWDGTNLDGVRMGSGLFSVRARWEGENRTRKLVIVR